MHALLQVFLLLFVYVLKTMLHRSSFAVVGLSARTSSLVSASVRALSLFTIWTDGTGHSNYIRGKEVTFVA